MGSAPLPELEAAIEEEPIVALEALDLDLEVMVIRDFLSSKVLAMAGF